jgi:VanZ family protein
MKISQYIFIVLFFTYVLLVLFFSLWTFESTPIDLSKYILFIRADHAAHFVMFFPYPISAWLAFEPSLRRIGKKHPLLTIFISGLVLAAVAELLQNLNPARDFDMMDMVANFSSIILSTILVKSIEKTLNNVWPGRLQ